MLTPQEQEFYTSLEQTFMTPGWALIAQGWKEEQEQLPMAAFFNAQTIEDVRVARVRYGILEEFIKLPESIQQQKESLLAQRELSENGE